MKVRAIHPHDNEYGAHYHKRVGTEYDVEGEDQVRVLISEKLVEEVKAPTKAEPAKAAKADPK